MPAPALPCAHCGKPAATTHPPRCAPCALAETTQSRLAWAAQERARKAVKRARMMGASR